MAIGDKLKRPLEHILIGIDGSRTHIKIVPIISLSLGTLRNGLSCLRLALRPFLCLLDYGRLLIFAVVTEPLRPHSVNRPRPTAVRQALCPSH
jgi:hypothetical protein